MTIGEKVKAAREEKRLSQKALADKIGLSEYTVIRLEKGRREPRPSELEKIAKVLGVPVASLYDAVPMKSDDTESMPPSRTRLPTVTPVGNVEGERVPERTVSLPTEPLEAESIVASSPAYTRLFTTTASSTI